MEKLNSIHLRLSKDEMTRLKTIVKKKELFTDLFSRRYFNTDALKEGLNLLYETEIEHKFKLVPTTKEEQKEYIEQDNKQIMLPSRYRQTTTENTLSVNHKGKTIKEPAE